MSVTKLKEYKFQSKIVAQTYGGALIMVSKVSGSKKRVQEQYPCATSHLLNLTPQEAAANVREIQYFFKL